MDMAQENEQNQESPDLNQNQQLIFTIAEETLKKNEELSEKQYYEAGKRIITESVDASEAVGAYRAYTQIKQDIEQILSERASRRNQFNAQKVVEARSRHPQIPKAQKSINVELPSLDEEITTQYKDKGAITRTGDASFPDDIQNAVDV